MEALERSKASLSSKLAVAQEEAAHLKAELGDHTSQTAKLKAQLHSIHDAHSKVSCTTNHLLQGPGLLCTFAAIEQLMFPAAVVYALCLGFGACVNNQADNHYSSNWACLHTIHPSECLGKTCCHQNNNCCVL